MKLQAIIDVSLAGHRLDDDVCHAIFDQNEYSLLPLLDAAYQVRQTYFGNTVRMQILNNVQNGHCQEHCSYCAQSAISKADICVYPIKSDEQIMAEAKAAYDAGAYRHCLVFSGKAQGKERIKKIANIVSKIKALYNMEICVSPGFIDDADATLLKSVGVSRLNHNLNTSERFYSEICSTHTFQDRLETVKRAKAHGLQVCSGIIVGMGETIQDLIDVAITFNQYKIESIPLNFFMPIKGVALTDTPQLNPEYCLRALCLFRLLNPSAEIRIAAGREMHLRSMQPLAFFPANSLFVKGYLNTEGDDIDATTQMIQDAGFVVEKVAD